jgi:ribonucleoside-diphosphate reductase alpha chain
MYQTIKYEGEFVNMFIQSISLEVWGGENGKYRLRDENGEPIDITPEDTCVRVAKGLAALEVDHEKWEKPFSELLLSGKFSGGGRIMANIGAGKLKADASPINCTVLRQIPDSMEGIMQTAKEAAMTLRTGAGTGYDFSPIRPKGAYVFGAGSHTSGVISFMKIFDAVCSTVVSGGSRRGAQMGCLDIQHPEVESFISCKREDGVLRYFNLSLLITDAFMNAVLNNDIWKLWFWERSDKADVNTIGKENIKVLSAGDIPFRHPEFEYFIFSAEHTEVLSGNCSPSDIFKKRVFKVMQAVELFNLIMKSTYDFAEPGFILIDKINKENILHFIEIIRATNPCGEQPLPPDASCLLGSMLLAPYIVNRCSENAYFDFDSFKADISTATRMMDNVVEVNNLPLESMRKQILSKRRHGLGFTGLGTAFNMLRMPYGGDESADFAEKIAYVIAEISLLENINLAKEKGCAPIFDSIESRKAALESGYLKRLLNSFDNEKRTYITNQIIEFGLRFSHATSIAPTGTMSLTWGNNCSNGIEPSFTNEYARNFRVHGKKTKSQELVRSLEYHLWVQDFGDAPLPDYWRTSDDLNVGDHIRIQAAVQKWVDSAVSKTANVPTDYPFEDFKEIYMLGWKSGLKGITTFRYNPEAFSGVLIRKEDLENTEYVFVLDDNSEVSAFGNDEIYYDGELHNAANLYDALKESMYGSM